MKALNTSNALLPVMRTRLGRGAAPGTLRTLSTSTTSNPPVLVSVNAETRVATITLNSPKTRNALSLNMLQSLSSALDSINPGWSFKIKRQDGTETDWIDLEDIKGSVARSNANTKIRCVVIKANYGDNVQTPVFCSGHDLHELSGMELPGRRTLFAVCNQAMLQIRRMPQIVLCEIDGLATAAGFQLATQSDLAVASAKSEFMFPGVNLGGFCTTPSIPASRLASPKAMLRMLTTAERATASEALARGLLSHVSPPGLSVSEFATQLANSIGQRAPYGTFIGKWAFWKQLEMTNLEEAYTFGAEVMCMVRELEDSKIGVRAWREKKKPVWDY